MLAVPDAPLRPGAVLVLRRLGRMSVTGETWPEENRWPLALEKAALLRNRTERAMKSARMKGGFFGPERQTIVYELTSLTLEILRFFLGLGLSPVAEGTSCRGDDGVMDLGHLHVELSILFLSILSRLESEPDRWAEAEAAVCRDLSRVLVSVAVLVDAACMDIDRLLVVRQRQGTPETSSTG